MGDNKNDARILIPINHRLKNRFMDEVGERQMSRVIRSLIEYYLEVMGCDKELEEEEQDEQQ